MCSCLALATETNTVVRAAKAAAIFILLSIRKPDHIYALGPETGLYKAPTLERQVCAGSGFAVKALGVLRISQAQANLPCIAVLDK